MSTAAVGTSPATDAVGFVRFEMNAGSWRRSEENCIFLSVLLAI